MNSTILNVKRMISYPNLILQLLCFLAQLFQLAGHLAYDSSLQSRQISEKLQMAQTVCDNTLTIVMQCSYRVRWGENSELKSELLFLGCV